MKFARLESVKWLWAAALAMMLGFAVLSITATDTHARGSEFSPPQAAASAGAAEEELPQTPIM
jgi:hypothetical protein